MSELLTREEYRAVAAGLTLPRTAFIDGSFRKAKSKKTFATINPANWRDPCRGRCLWR